LADDGIERPSIGDLLEKVEQVQSSVATLAGVLPVAGERALATDVHALSLVVEAIIVEIREHLSCHNCDFERHRHEMAEPIILDE